MSTDDGSPSSVYGDQVAGIIAGQPRDSSYVPAKPMELFVKNRRMPASIADLSPIEKLQLEKMFGNESLEQALRDGIEDMPMDLEIADVVDEHGTPVYRLYGWNYGVVYLMKPEALECVAFGCQHDLEHWNTSQRDVFWAMDRAMRRDDHGFQQPMKFCWWEQKCWDELAGSEPGSVQSEPYTRQQFAGRN
ncbi:MAG: hypothetical protein H0T46_23835 [Deltaproteobacteria bacterium]|nr:hypothetical protein [Deltaproteobacteria bacterium]